MEKILGGLVLVNGTDIWSTYGVFLVEDKRGGMDNLTAILTPSKTKTDTAVNGRDGWLEISFPQLALTLRVKYTDCSKFQPLTYLWKEGVHAGKFKVKFREPVPVI